MQAILLVSSVLVAATTASSTENPRAQFIKTLFREQSISKCIDDPSECKQDISNPGRSIYQAFRAFSDFSKWMPGDWAKKDKELEEKSEGSGMYELIGKWLTSKSREDFTRKPLKHANGRTIAEYVHKPDDLTILMHIITELYRRSKRLETVDEVVMKMANSAGIAMDPFGNTAEELMELILEVHCNVSPSLEKVESVLNVVRKHAKGLESCLTIPAEEGVFVHTAQALDCRDALKQYKLEFHSSLLLAASLSLSTLKLTHKDALTELQDAIYTVWGAGPEVTKMAGDGTADAIIKQVKLPFMVLRATFTTTDRSLFDPNHRYITLLGLPKPVSLPFVLQHLCTDVRVNEFFRGVLDPEFHSKTRSPSLGIPVPPEPSALLFRTALDGLVSEAPASDEPKGIQAVKIKMKKQKELESRAVEKRRHARAVLKHAQEKEKARIEEKEVAQEKLNLMEEKADFLDNLGKELGVTPSQPHRKN